eukprot:gene10125-2544_t
MSFERKEKKTFASLIQKIIQEDFEVDQKNDLTPKHLSLLKFVKLLRCYGEPLNGYPEEFLKTTFIKRIQITPTLNFSLFWMELTVESEEKLTLKYNEKENSFLTLKTLFYHFSIEQLKSILSKYYIKADFHEVKQIKFNLEIKKKQFKISSSFNFKFVNFESFSKMVEFLEIKEKRLFSFLEEKEIQVKNLDFTNENDEIFFDSFCCMEKLKFSVMDSKMITNSIEFKDDHLSIFCNLLNDDDSYVKFFEIENEIKIGTSFISNTIEHIDMFQGAKEFDLIPKSFYQYPFGTYFFGKVNKDFTLRLKITMFVFYVNDITYIKMDVKEKTLEIFHKNGSFYSKFKMTNGFRKATWEGCFDNSLKISNKLDLILYLDDSIKNSMDKSYLDAISISYMHSRRYCTITNQKFDVDGSFLCFEGCDASARKFILRHPLNKWDAVELYFDQSFNSFFDAPNHGHKKLMTNVNYLFDIKFKF